MPELAEVEYFRKQWDPGLGDTVREVALHEEKRVFRNTDPTLFADDLPGRRLTDSFRHGKQLLFSFEDRAWLHISLGMTGQLRAAPADFEPEKHDHLVLLQKSRCLVFTCSRMFGQARLFTGAEPPDFWQMLPPEILDRKFTEKFLRKILENRGGSVIKSLLLDQEKFPGIGNWMADEVLWQARIAPHRRVADLDAAEIHQLYFKLKHVCRKALETVGVNHGDPPRGWLFQKRWKNGGHCPKTGKPLKRQDIGGRTTAWSPAWQR